MYARLGRQRIFATTGLDPERVIPGIDVAQWPDHAEFGRCVRVRCDLLLGRLWAQPSLQVCAKARKKRWSPVRPSITGAGLPFKEA